MEDMALKKTTFFVVVFFFCLAAFTFSQSKDFSMFSIDAYTHQSSIYFVKK